MRLINVSGKDGHVHSIDGTVSGGWDIFPSSALLFGLLIQSLKVVIVQVFYHVG